MHASSDAPIADNPAPYVGPSLAIREAELRDIPPVVRLGASMHAEGAYSWLPYDAAKCERIAKFWIEDPGHLFLLAKADGRLVGMLAIGVASYMFCDELVASDRLVFVLPGKRGAGIAAALIGCARQWAIEKGCREFCLYQSTNVDPDEVRRRYESLGLTYLGGVFKERIG